MRRNSCFAVVFLLLFASLTPAGDADRPEAEGLALSFANNLWGRVTHWHTMQYLSTDHEPIVYSVTFSKSADSPTYKQVLKQLIRKGSLGNHEDMFATVLVSCVEDFPPIIAYYDGLPAHLCAFSKLLTIDGDRIPHSGDFIDNIIYVSPFEIYLTIVTAGESKTYGMLDLKARNPEKIPATRQLPDEQVLRNQHRWKEVRERRSARAPIRIKGDKVIISGVADWNQPNDYPGSCGPTSAACVLDYWDRHGYPKLRTGSSRNLIIELCDAMGWIADEGVTPNQMEQGLRKVCNQPQFGRNYNFSMGKKIGISFSEYKAEIDSGYPFCYGSYDNPWGGGHAVCGVGYSGNYIIVHDNWPTTRKDYHVNWYSIGHLNDLIVYVHPEGSSSSPSVGSPSAGANWKPGRKYNIKWSGFAGSHVKIELYRNRSIVTNIASYTPNDGLYKWKVPSGLENASDYIICIVSEASHSQKAESGRFSIRKTSGGGNDGDGGGGWGAPKVTKPGLDNIWWAGSSYNIQWSGFSGSKVRIDLYFGWYWVDTITYSTANDGSFNWKIPNSEYPGFFYYVGVCSDTGDEAFSNYFTIF